MNSKIATPLFLCLISGLLLGASQPIYWPDVFGHVGHYQWFLGALAFIAYAPFFWALRDKSLKETFWLTLFTMTVQFTVVLYWIYIALHDHGHISPIPAALITLLLPLILAFKGGVFFAIGRFISIHFSISFFLIAPVCLTAIEYFRNFQIFGGFPWGNVGYSLGRIDEFLQLASLVGVYGLVFFVGLINALICLACASLGAKRLFCALLTGTLIASVFSFGWWRLNDRAHEFAPTIKIAMLQGDIPQGMKNRTRLYSNEILAIYQKLHSEALAKGAELVIWPESSYPRSLVEDAKRLPSDNFGASIIGAITYGFGKDDDSYYHNSALAIDYKGDIIARYDKTHLVPFGEYVPWPLSGVVDKIVPGLGAFYPGTSFTPQMLAINPEQNLSLGITVCYEGIFPEISRAYAKKGATLLVNITNDAWYGRSSAPFQHLLMYKLRSVENGRSFVRATNSGLTAWIDAYGTVHRSLGLFERGLQINEVPLITKSTLYTQIGDVIAIICLLALIIAYGIAAVPLKAIIRERRIGDILIMLILIGIMVGSYLYFSQAHFMTIESAQTKKFFIFLLCMTIFVGALSRTERSRTILLVCAAAVLSISVGLAIFETPYFLFGLLIAVLIFLLALRIRKARTLPN